LPIACALAGLLLLAACQTTPAPGPGPEGVEVTLMIYSGRPNPKFDLDEAAITKLGQLLAATEANPDFKGATVTPSILGYQGVAVVNGAGASGLPDTLAVRGANVEVRDGDATRFKKDPGGALERYLLDLAVKKKAITQKDLARVR
jgi:hypothetical protein